MTAAPLTAEQQSAIDALAQAGRLRTVAPDATRASGFISQARERLSQLPLLTSHPVRYTLAYDAAHDVGEALLAAYGYRTAAGPGQHEALGQFVRIVVDAPPASRAAAARWDQHRRARNEQNYRAAPIGRAQADAIQQFTEHLLVAATHRGIA
jgi:hypothetical protein